MQRTIFIKLMQPFFSGCTVVLKIAIPFEVIVTNIIGIWFSWPQKRFAVISLHFILQQEKYRITAIECALERIKIAFQCNNRLNAEKKIARDFTDR